MKKTRFAILGLCVSLLCCITASFAWFISSSRNHKILLTTGTVDISAQLYVGNDQDHDGVLEEDSDGNEYRLLTKSVLEHTDGIFIGRFISYKLHVENSAETNVDASVSLRFSDLEAYIPDQIRAYVQNPSDTDALYNTDYSARLIFSVTGVYSVVQTGDAETPTITDESKRGEERFLWLCSGSQPFVEGVVVPSGGSADIYFQLLCTQSAALMTDYSSYCQTKTGDIFLRAKQRLTDWSYNDAEFAALWEQYKSNLHGYETTSVEDATASAAARAALSSYLTAQAEALTTAYMTALNQTEYETIFGSDSYASVLDLKIDYIEVRGENAAA